MTHSVDLMTLPQVRVELAAYWPHTGDAVITTDEHLERRQALWRKLDWWIAMEKAA